jgi:hypothetical protein
MTSIKLPPASAALTTIAFACLLMAPMSASSRMYWDNNGCYHDVETGPDGLCPTEESREKQDLEKANIENRRNDWYKEQERVSQTDVEIIQNPNDPTANKGGKGAVKIGQDFYKFAEKAISGAIGRSSGLSGLGNTFKNWKGGSALAGSVTGIIAKTDPGWGTNWPGRSQPFWEFQFNPEELACFRLQGCVTVKPFQIGSGMDPAIVEMFRQAANSPGGIWDLLHIDDRFRFYRDKNGAIRIAYQTDGKGAMKFLGGEFTDVVALERISNRCATVNGVQSCGNAAESIPVGPQDVINNSPLLLAMQGCFKLKGDAYKNCVDNIFRVPVPPTQINVDRYGLISPGPSGVYGQGWEEYGYTYDPTGVRGVPNPLVRVNLSTMGGSFSDQVFAPGAGLVPFTLSGPINTPGRTEPRSCTGAYDYILFAECGYRPPAPGVNPSSITYPSDEVINLAFGRMTSPTSYSTFGKPDCSFKHTDGLNLKWTISNPQCNSTSTIYLEGNRSTWVLSGLRTTAQRQKDFNEANRRQQEIVNQARPDFPATIPVSIYFAAWNKLDEAKQRGATLLGRDPVGKAMGRPDYLFSIERDGNIYCSAPGIHGSTVWCKQAISLEALDLLYNKLLAENPVVASGGEGNLGTQYLTIADLAVAAQGFNAAKGAADTGQVKANYGVLSSGSSSGNLQEAAAKSKLPDDVAAWAISELTGECVLPGRAQRDDCFGTFQDESGVAWSLTSSGMVTNLSTRKSWRLPLPAKAAMAPEPSGALHSVFLQNAASGRMLSVGTSSDPLMSSMNTARRSDSGGAQQQWSLVPSSGGSFKLVQQQTGKVLTPKAWETRAGAPLIAWDDTDAAVQKWYVRPVGGDWQYGFKLVNMASGLVVTPEAWSAAENNFAIQWYDTLDKPEQVWSAQQVVALSPKSSPHLHLGHGPSGLSHLIKPNEFMPVVNGAQYRIDAQWVVRRVPDRVSEPFNFSRRLSVLQLTDGSGRVLQRNANNTVSAAPYRADADDQRWVVDHEPDGAIAVRSASDGHVLNAQGANAVNVAADNGSTAMRWHASPLTELLNAGSNMVLGSRAGNLDIVQAAPSAGTRFSLVPTGDGFYRIVHGVTGNVLTPNAWSNAAGTTVIQWAAADSSDNNRFKQHWALQAARGGVRVVNRVSGLALAPQGRAFTANASMVMSPVDVNSALQVWSLQGLVPHVSAAQRELPVELIERAVLASTNSDDSSWQDSRGVWWDFNARAGQVTFSRRDQPLLNHSLKSPAPVISMRSGHPGPVSLDDPAPFWFAGANSGAIWLEDRARAFDRHCCVRTSLIEFLLKHPELELTTSWVGLGQPDVSGGGGGTVRIDGSVFKNGGQVSAYDGGMRQFRGRRFIIRGTAGPGQGRFDVFLNGQKVGATINAAQPGSQPYAAAVDDVPLFDSGNMPATWRQHTVEVRNRSGSVTIIKLDVLPNVGNPVYSGSGTGTGTGTSDPGPLAAPGTWGTNVASKQVGGQEAGRDLFVCRVTYQGAVHTGKTWTGQNGCNIGHGGGEVTVPSFETLATKNTFFWASNAAEGTPLIAGYLASGSAVYACRGRHEPSGTVHPGKTWTGHNGCNIGYGGSEVVLSSFEFLMDNRVQPPSNNPVPPTDVRPAQPGNWGKVVVDKQGGGNGGSLQYVCRVNHDGSTHAGKTWDGHGACNIGYAGSELALSNFEMLAAKDFKWTRAITDGSPVVAGSTKDGYSVYVCRGDHGNGKHLGKTWTGHNACNIGYAGKEVLVTYFEYLTGGSGAGSGGAHVPGSTCPGTTEIEQLQCQLDGPPPPPRVIGKCGSLEAYVNSSVVDLLFKAGGLGTREQLGKALRDNDIASKQCIP